MFLFVLFYVFGRSPNSNQARICVLWFSANRVWLVSHFIFLLVPAIGNRDIPLLF